MASLPPGSGCHSARQELTVFALRELVKDLRGFDTRKWPYPMTTRKISLFASFRIQSNPLESKPNRTNIGIIPSLVANGNVMPFSPQRADRVCLTGVGQDLRGFGVVCSGRDCWPRRVSTRPLPNWP